MHNTPSHALHTPSGLTPHTAAPLRVVIVGAGAIGGLLGAWLGARLPAGRVRLSVLARGATLAALSHHGLRWESAAGAGLGEGQGAERHTVALAQVSADPAELGPQDVVIVAVKAPALASVAPLVRALLAPHTQVLVAMNGVPWWFFQALGPEVAGPCAGLHLQSADPHGAIAAAIPTAQVVGCVVHISSSTPEPGLVRHAMGNGLILGLPAGGLTPELQALGALLSQAGLAVTLSERIQRDIWFKLWGNMTMNPVSALTGAACDAILDDALVRQFCSAVMLEAQAIGARIGCAIEQSPEDRHAITRKLGAFKTSMLQDLEAQRPLEIDALVATVREVGQHLGVATPHTDALLGLTRLMARTRGLYPN
jgi:2-dehydropantoate 2-reductase